VASRLTRYANARIVESFAYLLRFYETNSPMTNHCIAKLFHRLAFDCQLPAVLFQASLFRTFQKIMRDPASRSVPHLKVPRQFLCT
jgi:timeless